MSKQKKKDLMKTKKIKNELYKPVILDEKDFYGSITKAMESSKHKQELRYIIDEFEEYKKFVEENTVLCDLETNDILTFRCTYQGKKNVWKEIEVFSNQTLGEFARYLILEMGWMNDHLHAFFFNIKNGKKNSGYSYTMYEIGGEGVDNDQYPILHTDRVCLGNIDYKKHPKIGFVFDFGDDHRFIIEYKSTRKENKSDDFVPFPNLVDQRGVPPLQYPWTEDNREDFEMNEEEADEILKNIKTISVKRPSLG